MANSNKIKVLSLFSGAGGLDIGFSQAGFDVLVSTDVEEDFCKTIDLNIGSYYPENHKTICGDISKLDPSTDIPFSEFDFIIGGPPCQSFSAAGRRAGGVHGINDFRGTLFWHYCRMIEHYQPRGFLFENVRGILSANKGLAWKQILSSFNALGYKTSYRVLDAADYGVPQHRERLILVGLKDKEFLFPRPSHGPDSKNNNSHVSPYSAIKDLEVTPEEVVLTPGKYIDLLLEVPPGLNYLYFTEKMGHPNPRFAWRSRFSDFLYKAHPDLPVKTIVANLGKYSGPFHWDGRKFSFSEYKRLQSFPDDYEFFGSYVSRMKQLGNSVAPAFGRALAECIMAQCFSDSQGSLDLLDSDVSLSFDKRKGKKAKATKALVIKENDQLSLFVSKNTANSAFKPIKMNSTWYYKNYRQRIEKAQFLKSEGYASFNLAINSNKAGVVKAKILKQKANVDFLNIELLVKFHSPVGTGLSEINVLLTSDTDKDIPMAWDVIHEVVRKCTSYNSIHELYGHFTEPYPKFLIEISSDSATPGAYYQFYSQLTDFSYLSKLHRLKNLSSIFYDNNDEQMALEKVKELRSLGFDIRVHQTNRTIPDGYYRCCYPFTFSKDSTTFVQWHELGEHKTADRTSIPEVKQWASV